MFAVIKAGGKQYKVAKNDVIKLNKIEGNPGATIVFDEVLAFGDDKSTTLGSPLVKDIKVSAEVLEQKKDKKILIFKKKRRHNYRRKNGHRQQITVVRIQDIGKDLKAKAAPAKKAEEAPKAKAEKKTEAKKPAATKKTEAKKAETEKKEDK